MVQGIDQLHLKPTKTRCSFTCLPQEFNKMNSTYESQRLTALIQKKKEKENETKKADMDPTFTAQDNAGDR
jgi:hypothetical protein